MRRSVGLPVLPALVALFVPFCAPAVRVTTPAPERLRSTIWEEPVDLAERDLFYGPWGREHAPDPQARFTLVQIKHTGLNPGMTVRDPEGREWSVKQAFGEGFDEGPVEVVLSRVLSAVGYHQPPVYYLRSFTLTDDWGSHVEAGGRFRLKVKALKDRGEWSWRRNPFVGSRPYQGLVAIMMVFNNCDLKDANNTVYEYRGKGEREYWFVARDIGHALGNTNRFGGRKGDPSAFERDRFIRGVRGGFVAFDYNGWHQDLVRDRLTPADVAWAGHLLARLSDGQWRDAFRAGGYSPGITERFIRVIEQRIDEAIRLDGSTATGAEG